MSKRNLILMGQPEEIDLLRKDVRGMVDREGIYICGDTKDPGVQVIVVSQQGKLWSVELDTELAPERFLETVTVAGPFWSITDTHPEARCEHCGGPNVVWFAPNEVWNKYSQNYSILCPMCFVKLAHEAGERRTFKLEPEDV